MISLSGTLGMMLLVITAIVDQQPESPIGDNSPSEIAASPIAQSNDTSRLQAHQDSESDIKKRTGYLSKEDGREEFIEQSEVMILLESFERQHQMIIPDRDVLECQNFTPKALSKVLEDRLRRAATGQSTEVRTRIAGKTSIVELKPFQRRDLLNNPDRLLKTIDVTGPASTPSEFTVGGSQREGGTPSGNTIGPGTNERMGPMQPANAKDVLAQAILSIRPDIGNIHAANSSPFDKRMANYRKERSIENRKATNTSSAISSDDYASLVRAFLNDAKSENDSLEQFTALQVAIVRAALDSRTESYSNGAPRYRQDGREVYANGRPKFDNNGRPLYPNGQKKFADNGRSLHSNGRPKYSTDGTPLYATGGKRTTESSRTVLQAPSK